MTPSQNPINEESLLAMFDRLIDQGIVKFTTNYRTVRMDYDGFSVSLSPPVLSFPPLTCPLRPCSDCPQLS